MFPADIVSLYLIALHRTDRPAQKRDRRLSNGSSRIASSRKKSVLASKRYRCRVLPINTGVVYFRLEKSRIGKFKAVIYICIFIRLLHYSL
jgi:hypothetical protein